METKTPRTVRERVRVELTNEILEVARRHLALEGSAALSLRAVARDVGMVSSAIYRYFPSRDDLLTALIVDAYEAVGAAATAAESSIRRGDFLGRWLATCRAVRSWAVGQPQQYALIFGSPVPGYQAPQDTVDPAAVIPVLLITIIDEARAAGLASVPTDRPIPRPVHSDLRGLRASAGVPLLGDHIMAKAVMAWTQLIGSISFELFGHLHNVIFDDAAYFDFQMRNIALDLGLVP